MYQVQPELRQIHSDTAWVKGFVNGLSVGQRNPMWDRASVNRVNAALEWTG